jgi:hypothetical protein
MAALSAMLVDFTIISNPLIRVDAVISDSYIGALIDAGASCSLTDRRLWNEISSNENGKTTKSRRPAIGPIQSATGHHQVGDGSFRWPMTMRDAGFPVLSNVVDARPVPLLLVADFLIETSAIINYHTKTLSPELPSQTDLHMELLCSASAMLCAGKPIIVPPSTSIVLRCANPAISEHNLIYDPAGSYLQTLGLLSCLVALRLALAMPILCPSI